MLPFINARVAQLVEYDLAKVGVAGSSPVWVVHTKHERPVVQELQSVSKIMGS